MAKSKDKTAAVILAVLLGPGTWAYTYGKDHIKFWVCIIPCILGFGMTQQTGIAPLWYLPFWIWSLVDACRRPSDWYERYYLPSDSATSDGRDAICHSTPDVDTKICPKCAETIKAAATVCRFCGHSFPAEEIAQAQQEQQVRVKAVAAQQAEVAIQQQRQVKRLEGRRTRRLVFGILLTSLGGLMCVAVVGMVCSDPPANTQDAVSAVTTGVILGLFPLLGGVVLLFAARAAGLRLQAEQRRLARSTPVPMPQRGAMSQKARTTAGLLGIVFGGLGVHNFYLGYYGKAIAQLLISLLSCGLLAPFSAIWGLTEGILILTGSIDIGREGNPPENSQGASASVEAVTGQAATHTDAENLEVHRCWYCGINGSDSTAAIQYPFYKEIYRTPGPGWGTVHFQQATVVIPRCPSCKGAHEVSSTCLTVLFILFLLFTLIVCGITSGAFQLSLPGWIQGAVSLILAIVVASVAASSVSKHVRNTIGRRGARGAKEIRDHINDDDYPPAKQLLADGWKKGTPKTVTYT